jgi:hypothetical protein
MKAESFYVGQDIQIQLSAEFQKELKETGDIGLLFDELGDLVTVDEINPNSGEHWLAEGDNIFTLWGGDFDSLKEKGWCRIFFIGTIEERVDMDNENDRAFFKWYYNINHCD